MNNCFCGNIVRRLGQDHNLCNVCFISFCIKISWNRICPNIHISLRLVEHQKLILSSATLHLVRYKQVVNKSKTVFCTNTMPMWKQSHPIYISLTDRLTPRQYFTTPVCFHCCRLFILILKRCGFKTFCHWHGANWLCEVLMQHQFWWKLYQSMT